MAGVALYLAFQILFPLRHFLYPGNVNWTEEGHRFSWHMKLRDKQSDTRFFVTDQHNTWEVPASDYLTRRQLKQMSTCPDMITQFAHYLSETLQAAGQGKLKVRVWVMTSLNGRDPQLLIDPTVDVAALSPDLTPANRILPLVLPPYSDGVNVVLMTTQTEPGFLMMNVSQQSLPLSPLRLGEDANMTAGTDWGWLCLRPRVV